VFIFEQTRQPFDHPGLPLAQLRRRYPMFGR
jgi:hypothetical protein